MWRLRWTDFATINYLADWSRERQLSLLRLALPTKTLDELEYTLHVRPDTTKTAVEVLDLLQQYFRERTHEVQRRHAFSNCKQAEE